MTTPTQNRRSHVVQVASRVNDISWWLFVVASLIAGGVNWWTERVWAAGFSDDVRLYCPFVRGSVGGDCIVTTSGFADDHWFTDTAFYSMAAFAVLILAAIVEGVAKGRLVSGIVTVGLPIVAWGLFLVASPGVVADDVMKPIWAMLVVFLAVMLRETWARTLRRSNARRWSNHETA